MADMFLQFRCKCLFFVGFGPLFRNFLSLESAHTTTLKRHVALDFTSCILKCFVEVVRGASCKWWCIFFLESSWKILRTFLDDSFKTQTRNSPHAGSAVLWFGNRLLHDRFACGDANALMPQ